MLLQNRGGLLPLDKTKIKRIAVIGPLADRIVMNNYNGKAGETVTALQGIRDRVGAGVEVTYAARRHGRRRHRQAAGKMNRRKRQPIRRPNGQGRGTRAQARMSPSFSSARPQRSSRKARDRKTLGLTGTQEELVEAVFAANPKTIVVEMSAGPLTVPWIAKNVPALLQAWWPGEEGGHAIADVLFGDVNPAGRLPHTVYASEAQVPPRG